MNLFARWNAHSLAVQFLIAGGVVSILATVLVGLFVTKAIEDAVTRNSAAATALYVDSVVAPLLPDMQKEAVLDDTTARALDETLGQGALGQRLVSFKLWRADGTILYSTNKSLVGRKFEPNDKRRQAFAGALVARYEVANDAESAEEAKDGQRLLEIYNPVLQPWSGQVVAVLEFYEVADGFGQSLKQARLKSWLAVTGFTTCFFLLLSVIVLRGSRTIETQRQDLRSQVKELSRLLDENRALQRRLRMASQRAAALNESYLRRIGADLHDGPAQHVAYASLRLDSELLVDPATPADTREKEIGWIRSSLAEAMTEIRTICGGLVLPQIEDASLLEVVQRAIAAHQQRTKTQVKTQLAARYPEVSQAIKICVYRFVQESLNNAFRHGGAHEQKVSVQAMENHVVLRVEDNGKGFDPTEVRPTSLGLAGLRERVDSLGGTLDIDTGENGTLVTMTLPLESEETECP